LAWSDQVFLNIKILKFEAIISFKRQILPSLKLTFNIYIFYFLPCKVLGSDLEQIILVTIHNKGQKLMEIPFLPDPSDLLGEHLSLSHQPPEQRTITCCQLSFGGQGL
jgi:hypothetical protein